VKIPDASPVPSGSGRLSWDELAERTDATRERLERLEPVTFRGVSQGVIVFEAVRA
jgi:hypothetical protein